MGSSFAVLRVQLSPVLRFQTAKATELSDSVGFFRSEEGTQTEDRRKGEDKERGRRGAFLQCLFFVRIPRASLARLVSGIHRTRAQCSSLPPPSSAAVLCSSRRCSPPGALSLSSQRRGRRRLPQVLLLSLLGFVAAACGACARTGARAGVSVRDDGRQRGLRATACRCWTASTTATNANFHSKITFGCHASSLLALL